MGVRKRLNIKQTRALATLIDTGSTKDSARVSGYLRDDGTIPDSYYKMLECGNVRAAMTQALDREGVSLPQLAQKVKGLLNARKVQFFSHNGIVCDKRTVKDNQVILSAVALIGKWLGMDIQQEKGSLSSTNGIDLSRMSTKELDELISMSTAVEVEYEDVPR